MKLHLLFGLSFMENGSPHFLLLCRIECGQYILGKTAISSVVYAKWNLFMCTDTGSFFSFNFVL
jgi:hypothetical protein